MGKEKYLILDFGNVIAGAATGNWFITPNFFKIIDKERFDIDMFNKCIGKYGELISTKLIKEEEEYEIFTKLYTNILKDMNYEGNIEEFSKKIAYDFTYNDNKYVLFKDAKENLEKLSQKYKLLLLSDNWPCVFRIMKDWNIDKYFDKLYVSSVYHAKKEEKLLFDYLINDYGITKGEAIFIDDKEELVGIGYEKGLTPIVMDRNNEYGNCKYRKISSLTELL